MNNQSKTYRLLKGSPLTYLLRVGGDGRLLTFDKVEDRERAIRHCPNEREVFIEKQSDYAVIEPIVFEKGILIVPNTKKQTIAFLKAHPNNGNIFEIIDTAKEAEQDMVYEDKVLELKNTVVTKLKEEDGRYEVEALVSVILNSVVLVADMSDSELKQASFKEINSNPYKYYEGEEVSLFTDEINRKYLALKALSQNVLKVSLDKKSISWTDSNAIAVNVPTGLDPRDYLASFLDTDEGMLLEEEIKKRLPSK